MKRTRPARPGRPGGDESRFERLAALFHEAAGLEGEAREALLAEIATSDPGLRAEVERLLAHAGGADLSQAVRAGLADGATELLNAHALGDDGEGTERPVGRYRLLRLIGRGGMGVVYEAEQEAPKRRVALKAIRYDLASPALARRFELEAEVLGRLSHPGIARVFEAGAAEFPELGRQPFFAMELVEGVPLLEHAERAALSTEQRLELLARICDAVHHAHRKGVVHRDLKPDNILVREDGQPVVLDFGIARVTDSDLRSETLQTTAGEVLGTVPYMSPEQVAGRSEEIDQRTDVYSLGVLAYELLSGRRPYRLERLALPEAARVIRDEEPTRLGTLSTAWRGDVEVIVGKALEKEKERRYESAAALAQDLRRHLQHEPISARPPSTLYQVGKFARRHKGIVAGLALAIAALAAGTIVSVRFALREAEQAAIAEQERREARRQAYRSSLASADAALRAADPLAREFLEAAPQELRGWEWSLLAARLDRSVRILPLAGEGPIVDLAFSDDDRELLTVRGRPWRGEPRTLTVQDARSGESLRSVVLSRERPVLVRPGELGLARSRAVFLKEEEAIEYRDAETGTLLATDHACGEARGPREVIARAGDVALLADENQRTMACDLATGASLSPAGFSLAAGLGLRAAVRPDGREMAVVHGTTVTVATVAADAARFVLRDGTDQEFHPAWLGRDGRLATVSQAGVLRIWDAGSGELEEKHQLSTTALRHVVASPDARRLVVAGRDGLVYVWDVQQRELADTLLGHEGVVRRVALDSTGRLLATAGHDGTLRLWDLSPEDDLDVLRGHESYVYPVRFSPDGARIYSASWDATVRAWDAESREAVAVLPATLNWGLAVSPDSRRLATYHPGQINVHDLRTGELLAARMDGLSNSWAEGHALIAWDGDGVLSAVIERVGIEGREAVLDPDTLELVHAEERAASGWPTSPDGSTRVIPTSSGLELRSAADGRLLRRLEPHASANQQPGGASIGRAWWPDGSGLAVGAGGQVLAWRAPSWEPEILRDAHESRVLDLAFSPDGRLLASGGGDGVVRIWDATTLERLLQLRGHGAYVWRLAWSPDGSELVSGSGDGTLRVWSSKPLRERWLAREERRDARERLRPMVETLFGELGDAGQVADAVEARTAAESERSRRAALDLVMTMGAERSAETTRARVQALRDASVLGTPLTEHDLRRRAAETEPE